MQTQLLINGQFVKGEGAAISVLNPATGAEICQVNEASMAQIEAAVSAAAAAFKTYKKTTPRDRATLLLKLADAIEANAADFAELESQNCGKPYLAALNDEIPAVADVFRFFAGAVRNMTGSLAGEYLPGHTSMIRRDPLGVVASIAPWNYPLMMAAWKLGPALAAGNTVVLKPSEMTPLTTLKLAELIADIFPAGVVNILNGRGESVGAPMISQPQVQMISITGDISTGQKIMDVAAKSVKRTHLELGGKAPVIVFDDADLAAVVEGVRTFGFYNAGQDCTAACRIYAGKKIYEKLVAELSAAVSTIKVGEQKMDGVEMGPLISARQRERVAGFVERASAQKHIEVTTGGKVRAGNGFFYEPTIIAGAKQTEKCLALWFQSPVLTTKSKW
jgi:aminobutyraldehyde dehydrogenase